MEFDINVYDFFLQKYCRNESAAHIIEKKLTDHKLYEKLKKLFSNDSKLRDRIIFIPNGVMQLYLNLFEVPVAYFDDNIPDYYKEN